MTWAVPKEECGESSAPEAPVLGDDLRTSVPDNERFRGVGEDGS